MSSNVIEERKRKFLLIFPLIILPFCALFFYSLGGGRGKPKADEIVTAGLNPNLPSPQLESQAGVDKFSLYKKADRYALEQRKKSSDTSAMGLGPELETLTQIEQDPQPGYRPGATESPFSPGSIHYSGSSSSAAKNQGSTEERLNKRLAALQALLASKTADTLPKVPQPPGQDPAVEKQLASMQQQMQSNMLEAQSPDPQLQQMDGMLEKILDIQHPDRVKDRMAASHSEEQGKVYAVSAREKGPEGELLMPPIHPSTRDSAQQLMNPMPALAAFYDSDNLSVTAAGSNVIAAVIDEGKTVVSGATIKIRLSQDMYVQGKQIPKGNFVFGKCNLSGDRLMIEVSKIFYEGNLYPVALSVYDTYGMAGIPVDAGMEAQAAKESSDQAVQSLSLNTLDQSVGAQATMAGIEAAKKLISRKVKLVKVTLKANSPILLVDSKQL